MIGPPPMLSPEETVKVAFDRLRSAAKAVASLAGLAPHPNESGTRTGAARISGGRPCVRVALYMAAVSASRTDKGFRREYLALRQAGKPAKVAFIAIARRIAMAANSIIKSGRLWEARA